MFPYKVILLKLSGEIFSDGERVIHTAVFESIAAQIQSVFQKGIRIGIVVGGGNILRGGRATGIERSTADHMGMLATVINGLALQSVLERMDMQTRVMTAFELKPMAEMYIRRRALRHFEKGRIVIFTGGTGNPYFTTDTTAALRAAEIGADIILKGTNVDGVYDRDPNKEKGAVKFDRIKYMDALGRNLKVMDSTAISFCMENRIPIVVFNVFQEGNLAKVVSGESVGTYVD